MQLQRVQYIQPGEQDNMTAVKQSATSLSHHPRNQNDVTFNTSLHRLDRLDLAAMPYCGPSGATEICRWANIPPGDEVEVEFDMPEGCKAREAWSVQSGVSLHRVARVSQETICRDRVAGHALEPRIMNPVYPGGSSSGIRMESFLVHGRNVLHTFSPGFFRIASDYSELWRIEQESTLTHVRGAPWHFRGQAVTLKLQKLHELFLHHPTELIHNQSDQSVVIAFVAWEWTRSKQD